MGSQEPVVFYFKNNILLFPYCRLDAIYHDNLYEGDSNMSKMPVAMRYILRPFYGNYLKLRYGLDFRGEEKLDSLMGGPAIVFSNHVHTLDPFFISARFPLHIRWVAGAYLFKMKIPSFLLRHWVQAIPKTQGRSDLETIRSISSALKNGDVVGLFPEGTRTWDGRMMDITEATAKLVRLFKVPTVFINIEGGFSKKPRWSQKERRGKVYLTVKKVLTPDEIKGSSLPELVKIVSDNLSFDTTAWQKEKGLEYYDSSVQAEGIERVVYACSSCGSFATMHSEGTYVVCSRCMKKYEVNGYYDLIAEGKSISLAEYHEKERSMLSSLLKAPVDTQLFPDGNGILFQRGEKGRNVPISKDFKLSAFPDRIVFKTKEIEKYVFPFSEIESMIICAKYTVEFYHKGILYRFRLKGKESTLIYQDLYFEWLKLNKDY